MIEFAPVFAWNSTIISKKMQIKFKNLSSDMSTCQDMSTDLLFELIEELTFISDF